MVAISRAATLTNPRRNPGTELHRDVLLSIQEDLALKRSRRAIAIAHGVHRSTVDAIAAGEHITQRSGSRFRRCPNGHLTLLPCRTCACLEEQEQTRSKHKQVAA